MQIHSCGDSDPPPHGPKLRDPLQQDIVAGHDQPVPTATAPWRWRCDSFRLISPSSRMVSAKSSRRQGAAPAAMNSPLQHLSPIGRAAETTTISQSRSERHRQIDYRCAAISVPIEQDGFLRQPGKDAAGLRPESDVERCCRPGARDRPSPAAAVVRRQPGALAARISDVEAIAAGKAPAV